MIIPEVLYLRKWLFNKYNTTTTDIKTESTGFFLMLFKIAFIDFYKELMNAEYQHGNDYSTDYSPKTDHSYLYLPYLFFKNLIRKVSEKLEKTVENVGDIIGNVN